MIDIAKLKARLDRPGRTAVSGVPQGLDAMLLPEIAKAAGKRVVVHVAVDDQRAAVLADQLAYFAPKLEILRFPAWDCLPYDRVSPVADIVARRLATLARLLEPVSKPLLLLTTIPAVLQRVVPRTLIAGQSFSAAPGNRVNSDELISFLAAERLLAHRHRGGPRRLRRARRHPRHLPAGFGRARAPRLLRRHAGVDPQLRPRVPAHHVNAEALHPQPRERGAAERRSRSASSASTMPRPSAASTPATRSMKASPPAASIRAWSTGCRCSMTSSRRSSTISTIPIITLDHSADEAAAARQEQVAEFYNARREGLDKKETFGAAPYKPVKPATLYLTEDQWAETQSNHTVLAFSAFDTPGAISFGGKRGRSFAAERAQAGRQCLRGGQGPRRRHPPRRPPRRHRVMDRGLARADGDDPQGSRGGTPGGRQGLAGVPLLGQVHRRPHRAGPRGRLRDRRLRHHLRAGHPGRPHGAPRTAQQEGLGLHQRIVGARARRSRRPRRPRHRPLRGPQDHRGAGRTA